MFLKKIEDKKINSLIFDDEKKNKPLDPTIVDLLSKLDIQWDFMINEEFNPVSVALSLLDNSSLGRNEDDFNEMLDSLNKAMDIIVNESYLSFNNSIYTFSGVVGNLTDSQKRVREMKQSLIHCKELLQCKRSDLMQQWTKSIEYKEMIQMLDTIDELRDAPDKILELISSKHYLTATKYLLKYLEIANNIDYQSIGALDDIRHDLNIIKASIYNSLIEDLHNHIYLKSKFCTLQNSNEDNENNLFNGNDIIQSQLKLNDENSSTKKKNSYNKNEKKFEHMNTSKLFYKKLDENYQNEEIVEDPEKNPELDSYNFMKIILECLRLLEQLPEALETIRQRLPLELYSVVEKTINEIDKKNENSYNISKNSKHIFKSKNISDLIGINSQEAKSNLLKDMLKLLYSKLDSIVQIHAFILNTSEKMLKLEGIQSTTYTIRDVWIAVQNEIRSLLYDYLTSPETGTNTYQNLFYSINERLKDSKKNRERNKLLFRFIDEDFTKSTNELFKKNNIYDNVLKDVIKRKEHNHTQSLIVIDKYSNSHKVIGHKLLLPPDSRRVLAIFKPTCDFMEKMENIVSISKGQDDISDFRVFLDDFICNIFLPQMEEKVMEYFHLYISGEDEFQAELNESLYPWPLLKSSVACVIITKGLCSTINDVPIHQEKFIYMIEEIINKYYEKCVLRFKALLSCDQSITNNDQTICSKWIKEEEIIQLLSQNSNLLNRSDLINKDLDGKLAKEELNIELGLKEDRSFERGELIFDYNKLEALANLNHSLEWLVLQIKRLLSQNIKINKTTLDEKIMSSSSSLEINDLMNTNSNESLAMHQPKSDKPISLEISEEMQNRIVSILNNFQNLSEMCLYALRIELRCHAMFYLDLSFREGNFLLDNEIPEPDSYVFMLNKDLIKCEEIMKSILKPNKNRFLFNDLGSLMVNILMTNVKYIKCINKNGILRLGRNVRSIQQVLNSISGSYESSMDIAKEYFELLDLDSEEFMKKIEDNGQGPFTYEQLKFLLDLMNSEYLNKDLILQKLEKEKQIQLARSLTNINVDDDFASLQNEKRNIDEIQNKYYEYVEKLKMLCSDSY
ncbi:hypothetical protein H8356DRAFT_1743378 [Neocallimastix lanati (nom. inval.)]|jgi:exocyst complex component 4|uniref:Exocyst complex component Sec8 n=1 Tax=Neocallimastix californiae TaxID=1754190 RepID=A0A1Y2BTT0_9FUNG|nr:hypothetical protein H8356DRAFT_1743378 [Neocallimastix sp. JGI-2020a]ORY37535.1 hypothetical protein LY90DRAFT_704618 [Neocallimastix californiae]|eukprot:ORY37535.1 hypothetical protein LY90DRAFT_704618 [Neocallimastix californiae]